MKLIRNVALNTVLYQEHILEKVTCIRKVISLVYAPLTLLKIRLDDDGMV
jgi:hypothetical protein